jgi:hypothetical protein
MLPRLALGPPGSPLASFVGALGDAAAVEVIDVIAFVLFVLLLAVLPPRRLWRLHRARTPEAVKFILSGREPEPTIAYDLPVTGVGQVLALGALTPSLVRSYGLRWKGSLTILPGRRKPDSLHLRGNLIVLGGQHGNEVTAEILDRHGAAIGVEQRYVKDPGEFGDILRVGQRDGSERQFGGTPQPVAGGRRGI